MGCVSTERSWHWQALACMLSLCLSCTVPLHLHSHCAMSTVLCWYLHCCNVGMYLNLHTCFEAQGIASRVRDKRLSKIDMG